MACCDRHLVRGTLFVGSADQHSSDRDIPLGHRYTAFRIWREFKTERLLWSVPSFRVLSFAGPQAGKPSGPRARGCTARVWSAGRVVASGHQVATVLSPHTSVAQMALKWLGKAVDTALPAIRRGRKAVALGSPGLSFGARDDNS